MTVCVCTLVALLVTTDSRAEPLPAPESETAYHGEARQTVRKVLATREFAHIRDSDGRSVSRIVRWLGSVFDAIGDFFASLPGWLVWLLVGWMLITLIAIMAHLLWTLMRTLGLRSGGATARSGRANLSRYGATGEADLAFEQVYERAGELTRSGQWGAAIRHLHLAGLLQLDLLGCVTFRASKTNHDYLTETDSNPRVHEQLAKLTRAFEAVVYGGEDSDEPTCTWMARTVENLCHETTELTTR